MYGAVILNTDYASTINVFNADGATVKTNLGVNVIELKGAMLITYHIEKRGVVLELMNGEVKSGDYRSEGRGRHVADLQLYFIKAEL